MYPRDFELNIDLLTDSSYKTVDRRLSVVDRVQRTRKLGCSLARICLGTQSSKPVSGFIIKCTDISPMSWSDSSCMNRCSIGHHVGLVCGMHPDMELPGIIWKVFSVRYSIGRDINIFFPREK